MINLNRSKVNKMNAEYKEAFSEVDQILSMMPSSLSDKIPLQFKQIISKGKSTTYMPKIEEPIEQYPLREETLVILALIYRDFLCPKEEKAKLLERDSKKLAEFEKELREKYNPDNLFKNKKESDVEYKSKDKTSMMIVQEEKWYKKIFNMIKNLFKRNT